MLHRIYDSRPIESIINELGETPRPEHPRPDRYRSGWLNLNGVWEFAFDEENAMCESSAFDSKIIVPFCPESVLSGVYNEELHPVCWYARTFDLPENMQNHRLLLHFGAVDYETDVWLNGKHLGKHVGGYDSFYFDVTDYVTEKDNRIVVRVFDDPAQEKPYGKQYAERYTKVCFYMRVTGIWQTVWLESVGSTFIENWQFTCDVDNGVLHIAADINGCDQDLSMTATVRLDGSDVTRTAQVADGKANISIQIPDHELWSPEHPKLYDICLALQGKDGREVDCVDTYFGFRSVRTDNGQILLNNKPFFLISALDQGYYPDGLYTPPTDDALREDVLWAKRYGLNNVRKHQIIAEPRFHYWCDKLGLTIWEEMPDWGMDILKGGEELLRQWSACMKRDINHPCIITWVSFNEKKDPENPDASSTKVRLYEATKAIDPTRPAIDNSGYCHTITDITDLHVNPETPEDWLRWWSEWRESIAENGNFPAWPDRPTYCEGYRHTGQPVVISETGNWYIAGTPHLGDWEPYGIGPIPSYQEYIKLYRGYFTALAKEPGCAGFSYVQLYDVEGEINGYLTYDRKPRIPCNIIAEIHQECLKLRGV